ncbi:hypothetical protein JCM19274_2785 [Algibacter lectus]|uniref:Polysaccharide lyase family 8 central domain-containing protein n=1 Tax=Algibacter lectus TaxID=221126 RepID=A0A090X1W5_9FLAO|nr:polysaccharide lyase family 8 super-sandwich domain-containing protein [Algibacter lectus]GAL82074.1 hypothetical protein JCM19274_2785 [Algibacter lectus]
MKTGQEYYNIYPYWNWRQIPGTTAVQSTEKLPEIGWDSYNIESDFVGGLTFKDITVSTMQYKRDGVEANKSYFISLILLFVWGGRELKELKTKSYRPLLSKAF